MMRSLALNDRKQLLQLLLSDDDQPASPVGEATNMKPSNMKPTNMKPSNMKPSNMKPSPTFDQFEGERPPIQSRETKDDTDTRSFYEYFPYPPRLHGRHRRQLKVLSECIPEVGGEG